MNELRMCIHCIPLWGFKSGAQTITVRSLVSPKPTSKTQTKQQTRQTPQTNKPKKNTKAGKGNTDKTAPKDHSSWCAGELRDLIGVCTYKGGPHSVSKIHINLRCKKRTQKLALPFYYVDARGRVLQKPAIEAL